MEYLFLFVLPLLGAGAGAYFGAYLKKKGENLATHEDIDKLVKQVAAVTTTTKEIEAKISDDVWNRQKHWELRRDAFLNATKAIGHAVDGLITLNSTYKLSRVAPPHEGHAWVDRRSEAHETWEKASAELIDVSVIIELVCKEHTRQMFAVFHKAIIDMVQIVMEGEGFENTVLAKNVYEHKNHLMSALKQELGITPQSSESAVAPSPVPPSP